MDTSYWEEIDAQFGRGARVALKQREKKVKVVERESENKGKRKWESYKKGKLEKKKRNNAMSALNRKLKVMETSYCKEIDAGFCGEAGLPQNKGKVKHKSGSGDI